MLQGTVLALYVAGAAAINTLDAGKGDAKHAPPPPTYNLTRALLLAEASYCTATEDQPLLPAELRKTIIVTKVVDNHATRAVVGWDASDRSLFVSFRGTENDQELVARREIRENTALRRLQGRGRRAGLLAVVQLPQG